MSSALPPPNSPPSERRRVCMGKWVDVCYPLPSDYPFLIALRNRADVRRWFIDNRVLEVAQAAAWLAARSTRRDDVLLLIRHRKRDLNIGSIGWTQLNEASKTAEFGRLALDPEVLRRMARDDESRSILAELALDACLAVRDYAFSELGLTAMLTCYKTGNVAAAAINKACGMMPSAKTEGVEDGMTYLELTRQHWEKIRSNDQ